MTDMAKRLKKNGHTGRNKILRTEEELKRQVAALFGVLSNLHGSDKLVLKAGKVEALHLMRSERLADQVLALERLVFEDPTLDELPERDEVADILGEIEDAMADLLARRSVEEKLEKKIAERMHTRHEEYVKELRSQILKEESGPDNAHTLRKYAELEKLEQRQLAKSALETLRPATAEEVVGQEQATRGLFAKVACPYPQHVILYGPPGVGKTTVARLALAYARALPFTPFGDEAPFVEVDGSTLRWDPREVTNPLLGSVHDPIYQGARRELADSAVPEPKPGLATDAHGGVLFIDEIGELDLMLQNKLLKVLEDKRVHFDSAYYDPSDTNVPKYIKKLFEEGAPADFVLIGATTRSPQEINPALRSRCAEVYFEPLGQTDIEDIVKKAAVKLGVETASDIPSLIGEYTTEGRKATAILADAYGLALYRESLRSADTVVDQSAGPPCLRIGADEIYEVVQTSRLTHHVTVRATDSVEVGRVFGLGVNGYIASLLEIEAVVFPAREHGKGSVRFNQMAGKMASDSVYNAASVVRKVTGRDLANWDVHVNVVGGANIDGPSAGAAILTAIISALEECPVHQNVALTGEVSIQGRIKPVGGVHEKMHAARQARIRRVLIPQQNARDLPETPDGIEVIPVAEVEEILALTLEGWVDRDGSQRPRTQMPPPPPSRGASAGV